MLTCQDSLQAWLLLPIPVWLSLECKTGKIQRQHRSNGFGQTFSKSASAQPTPPAPAVCLQPKLCCVPLWVYQLIPHSCPRQVAPPDAWCAGPGHAPAAGHSLWPAASRAMGRSGFSENGLPEPGTSSNLHSTVVLGHNGKVFKCLGFYYMAGPLPVAFRCLTGLILFSLHIAQLLTWQISATLLFAVSAIQPVLAPVWSWSLVPGIAVPGAAPSQFLVKHSAENQPKVQAVDVHFSLHSGVIPLPLVRCWFPTFFFPVTQMIQFSRWAGSCLQVCGTCL